MVTIHTDKTGRKFEIHTNFFGSIVKQVEIFDAPVEDIVEDTVEDIVEDTVKDIVKDVVAKPAKRKGKK